MTVLVLGMVNSYSIAADTIHTYFNSEGVECKSMSDKGDNSNQRESIEVEGRMKVKGDYSEEREKERKKKKKRMSFCSRRRE